MSKAFTKDDAAPEELSLQPRPLTDPGENYMTSGGLEKLKQELMELQKAKEVSPDRLRLLQESIASANVIDPTQQSGDRVIFGATVTVTDEAGHHRIYKLVGVNETNAAEGKVSWISPIGKALLQAQVGDAVVLKTPRLEEELEIKAIEFKPI